MKTIIVTGASSGIGKVFCENLQKNFQFDELIVIARRKENLEKLQESLPFKVKVLPLDLTNQQSFVELSNILAQEKREVQLLINCSGFGKFGKTTDVDLQTNLNMIDLNCKAIVSMCQIVLPFMVEGARIINIASVAALQPIPYIGVYGASKAFVLSYSRALNRELKSRKISVTAVCPFWTKTQFFNRAKSTEHDVISYYAVMYDAKKVVKHALKRATKRKRFALYGGTTKMMAFLARVVPTSTFLGIWNKQQKFKKKYWNK